MVDITVTSTPLRVNCQNEIGLPDFSAMPTMTMLALDPTAVRLPPRSPPRANDHHMTSGGACRGMTDARWLTIGVMVATYGTLSMIPDSNIETPRISIVVNSTLPPVASAAIWPSVLITPVLNSAPTIMNSPTMNSSVSHSTLAR